MRLKGLVSIGVGLWFGLGGIAQAATLTIEITNTTVGHPFKELLVAAHGVKSHLFNSGYLATLGLEALAECGDQSVMATEFRAANPKADVWDVEFDAVLNKLDPGDTISIGPLEVTDKTNIRLSIAGRMMATNDGFAGLEAVTIPTEPGTYAFDMLAFDAGTEPNNELLGKQDDDTCLLTDPNMAERLADLPDDDYLGVNGTGAAGKEAGVYNYIITIHRGVLGDSFAGGDKSDLDFAHHRWTNPVATVTVIVQ